MGKLGRLLLLGASGALVYTANKRRNAALVSRFYDGVSVAVTGGASGIGRAIVEGLVERGALVLAIDADAAGLERLRTELPVATLQLDMTDPAAPGDLIEAALHRLGGLDAVFSNHGVVWPAPFLEMRHADIDRLVDVNFTSHVRLTRALLPFFSERGRGVVAYTGSLSARVYCPMHSVYTGTKGGLHGFVAAVRRELGHGHPVQLTIVQPNFTRTGLVSPGLWDLVGARFPMQTPAEVSAAFLAGVALGRKEVFVEVPDILASWAEHLAPPLVDWLFAWGVTAEMIATASEEMRARGGLAPGQVALEA